MTEFGGGSSAPGQLQTPVVLLLFNRPDTTRRVFAAIREVRPTQLFAIADGPRPLRPEDTALCSQARAVLDEVDWPCTVITNFSESNLGCRRRVSSGIDWVFSQVEEAIILEDDCLPHPSFFRFCSELLERYREEPLIGQIGGVNFQPTQRSAPYSYYFSRYNHVWGWATWRRAWILNDDAMTGWPTFRDGGGLNHVIVSRFERRYWVDALDLIAAGKLDTWDCQWTLSCWQNRLLTILPQVNLVSNIGFRPDATHTTEDESRFACLPVQEIVFPLQHPSAIVTDQIADDHVSRILFRHPTLINKLAVFLKRCVRNWHRRNGEVC